MPARRQWTPHFGIVPGPAGLILVLLISLLSFSAPAAQALEMEEYDLRTASFRVPADWSITYQSRDQEYDFASPDGRYQLWARWWFPDEPLLGFDDIVAHETRMLAGQEALFIHIESGSERMLEIAFPEQDAEGEQFLFQLMAAPSVPLADHRAMLEQLLQGLFLNGRPALAAIPVPQPPGAAGAIPVPQPPQTTPGPVAPASLPAPSAPIAPEGRGRYVDAAGAFSLPLADGWSGFPAEAAGLRQVVLLSPARDAMVLAAVAQPDAGRSAAEVMAVYVDLLYREAVIPKSIESEAWPVIAGAEVHAVETISRVYAINGMALPYTRGRVWMYRGEAAAVPFLLLTIAPQDSGPEMGARLAAMAEGFATGGQGAASASAPAPEGDAPPRPAGLLFDGQRLDGLLPLAFNGADFAQHATIRADGLHLSFPDDMGWAKAGFAAVSTPMQMPGAAEMRRIVAAYDGERTQALTIALVPPEAAGADPYDAHLLQLQFINLGDGKGKVILSLLGRAETAEAKFPWPAHSAVFDIWLRPDQRVEIREETGVELALLGYDARLPPGPVVVQALLPVERKNHAAALVLQRLTTEMLPFDPPPSLDALVTGPTPEQVLFDGLSLAGRWAGNERRSGDFLRFARLSDQALRIAWAPEEKVSYLGIISPEVVLWSDLLRGTGEARLVFDLDPASTGDVEFGLLGRYSLPGNLGDNESFLLRIARQPEGGFNVTAHQMRSGPVLLASGLAAVPDRVTLVLRPGRVVVQAAGVSEMPVGFPLLAEGVGLRVSVHAKADAEGRGAVTLRRISRQNLPGRMAAPAVPSPGVAPLPQNVLFAPPMGPEWEGRSAGKAEFAALASDSPAGLTLRRRTPVPDWNRIAVVGVGADLRLDYRVETTPYDLTLSVVPADDLGMRLFLSDDPTRHEDSARIALTMRVLPDGPDAGGLELLLHTGHFSYDHWRRVLPRDWWAGSWDGRIGLRLGDGWIAVLLDGRPIIRGATAVSARDRLFHPVIMPGGAGERDPGVVTVTGLVGGWVTPDGMDAAERMRLLDPDVFDPDAFADLLAADLTEE